MLREGLPVFQKVAEYFGLPNEQAVVIPKIVIISNCQDTTDWRWNKMEISANGAKKTRRTRRGKTMPYTAKSRSDCLIKVGVVR